MDDAMEQIPLVKSEGPLVTKEIIDRVDQEYDDLGFDAFRREEMKYLEDHNSLMHFVVKEVFEIVHTTINSRAAYRTLAGILYTHRLLRYSCPERLVKKSLSEYRKLYPKKKFNGRFNLETPTTIFEQNPDLEERCLAISNSEAQEGMFFMLMLYPEIIIKDD